MDRRMRLAPLVLLLCASVFGAQDTARRWTLDLAGGEVQFLAHGKPVAMRIRGVTDKEKGESLTGKLEIRGLAVTGEARYKLDALDTGVGLRNKHMKEKYLETGKHPSAIFKLTKLQLPQAFIDGDFDADAEPFAGELTLHDVTRPVQGSVDLKRSGDLLRMDFAFEVKLKEFKIEVPTFLSITMADVVDVGVSVAPKLKP